MNKYAIRLKSFPDHYFSTCRIVGSGFYMGINPKTKRLYKKVYLFDNESDAKECIKNCRGTDGMSQNQKVEIVLISPEKQPLVTYTAKQKAKFQKIINELSEIPYSAPDGYNIIRYYNSIQRTLKWKRRQVGQYAAIEIAKHLKLIPQQYPNI